MDIVPTTDQQSIEVVEGVHLTQLAVGDRMSVQHYQFEPGAVVPVHDHPHEQSGFIHQGTLTFILEDGTEQVVIAGTGYDLASGEAHGAENRSEETVLGVDIFSPPRPAPDWAE